MERRLRLDLRVTAGPFAASAVRHSLDGLEEVYDTETVEGIRLLINELVTNSFRHADARDDSQIHVCIEASSERVRVQVNDEGSGFEMNQRRRGDETGGWGLFLVDHLSSRWGVDRKPNGTTVWFEMDEPLPSRRLESMAGANAS